MFAVANTTALTVRAKAPVGGSKRRVVIYLCRNCLARKLDMIKLLGGGVEVWLN